MSKIFSDLKKITQTIFAFLGIYRRNDGLIAGVCKGLAIKFNWNVHIVRIIFIISPFITFGTSVIIYLLMAIGMPKPKKIIPKKTNDYIDVNSKEL